MQLTLLILIVVGLIVHSYLDVFFELKMLPFPGAFSLFVNIFALAYAVSLVWMFGVGFGLLLTFLCYFSIVNATALWIFMVPLAWRMQKNPESLKVNPVIHWCHSKIALLVGILAVVSMFTTPYASIAKTFPNYSTPLIGLLIVIVCGNVLRVVTMSVLKLK